MTTEELKEIRDCLDRATTAAKGSVIYSYARGQIIRTHVPALLSEVERLQRENATRDAENERLTKRVAELEGALNFAKGELEELDGTLDAGHHNLHFDSLKVIRKALEGKQPQPQRKRYEWRTFAPSHENGSSWTHLFCDGQQVWDAWVHHYPPWQPRGREFVWSPDGDDDSGGPCDSIADGQARILAALGINPGEVQS